MALGDQTREIPKLGVAIRMRGPFPRLPVGLQTVPRAFEQSGDGPRSRDVVVGESVGRVVLVQVKRRRFRVARVVGSMSATSAVTRPGRSSSADAGLRLRDMDSLGGPHPPLPGCPHVAQAGMNGQSATIGSQTQKQVAISDLACLRGRPLPPAPLIQFRRHDPILAPKARDRRGLSHAPL